MVCFNSLLAFLYFNNIASLLLTDKSGSFERRLVVLLEHLVDGGERELTVGLAQQLALYATRA